MPQFPQNFFPSSISLPQDGHIIFCGESTFAPHIPQNFFPSAISAPQLGQVVLGLTTILVPQFPQNFFPLAIAAPQLGQIASFIELLSVDLSAVKSEADAFEPTSVTLLNADLELLKIDEVNEEKLEFLEESSSLPLFKMLSVAFVLTSVTLLKADREAFLTEDINPELLLLDEFVSLVSELLLVPLLKKLSVSVFPVRVVITCLITAAQRSQ